MILELTLTYTSLSSLPIKYGHMVFRVPTGSLIHSNVYKDCISEDMIYFFQET